MQLFTKIWGQNNNAKMQSLKTGIQKPLPQPAKPNYKSQWYFSYWCFVSGIQTKYFLAQWVFAQVLINPLKSGHLDTKIACQNTRWSYLADLYISYTHTGIVEMGKLFELGKFHSSTFRQFPVGWKVMVQNTVMLYDRLRGTSSSLVYQNMWMYTMPILCLIRSGLAKKF